MAQGVAKLKGGQKKKQTQSKIMKSKAMKKGARDIKPKRKAAVQAKMTKKDLTKKITRKIEAEMKERAGSSNFTMVKGNDDTSSKGHASKK
eukprot:m.341403 g.341403  ORF g.341403 m.341403 type:complete len:91 (-) comp20092_c0_seq1:101-373(-)